VDGAAFYDNGTSTWHYLGQCIGRQSQWDLCHYSLRSKTPFSTTGFDPDGSNPVVKGGQLWSQICSGAGKHCPPATVDEGTPDIIKKENDWFYVTFHGFEYQLKRGARGVAKTKDWHTWEVTGSDLPGDAMFTGLDCNGWNISWATGGCIGGGEGSILISGDYYYELIEAPDISLICLTTEGVQNWVLGLLRSPALSPSGQWEQKQNPTIVPWRKFGCALQYHRIFSDGSNVYLSYYIIDFSTTTLELKIFQLVPGTPIIPMVASMP